MWAFVPFSSSSPVRTGCCCGALVPLRDGWDRDRIVEAVQAQGVPCLHGGSSEIYLEKAFDGTGFRPPERLLVARELGETSLMFLVDHTLSAADMHAVADAVERVMREAARLQRPDEAVHG